jgi:hypothetical protein
MRGRILALIGCLAALAVLQAGLVPGPCSAEESAASAGTQSSAGEANSDVFRVNLGDYAQGDGSDETEAIQRAIDAIPSRYDWPNSDPKQGGLLYVPRPRAYYGISKTLDFTEKWNITIECESPAIAARLAPTPAYFKWIGAAGDQPMFSFNTLICARVINLSLDGRSAETVDALYAIGGLDRAKEQDPAFGKPQATGLVGIYIGPTKEQEAALGDYPGIAKNIFIQNLRIQGCEVGIWVGGYQHQSDTSHIRIADASIGDCASYGIVVNSTMAVVQFDNTLVSDSGLSNVKLYGGDVGFSQYCGLGSSKDMVADIELTGGGLRIFGAWSETYAPFIKAAYGPHMYPTMPRTLIGAMHGSPYGGNVSLDYDFPTTLSLIGCAFRGDVVAGPKSGPIIAMGVTFGHPEAGFRGEGITKYGRLVRIGTAALESSDPSRALVWGLTPRTEPRVAPEGTSPSWNDPYILDRRNWPGTAPPTEGVWQKGDGVINTDPDPNVPARAWRGWICIEAGEPGVWRPYGAIGE